MRVSSASELKNSSSKVVAVQHWHEETTAATDSGWSISQGVEMFSQLAWSTRRAEMGDGN